MHVDGKNFSNCTSDYLDALKMKLTKILMLPPAFISIVGVEPSSSLLITIMIPTPYAHMLVEFAKDGYDFPELQDIGIDIIIIGDYTYTVKGTQVI